MNRRSDNGVIVVVVAACLFVLTAFSAIVIDQGVFWVARSQAQNAADAAAMAGALFLKDNPLDGPGASAVAQAFAGENRIWGEQLQNADIEVSSPLPAPCPTPNPTTSCITVAVYKGVTDPSHTLHTNYLPTFFANLLGIHHQGISATATASYLPTPGLVR